MRGGLRTRLIVDSARVAVLAGLEQLGWFDATVHDTPPGLRHHLPFRYLPRPTLWTDDVQPNSLAISSEDVSDEPLGLGGEVEDRIELYIDLFAQDDDLGWHVSGDIRDLLVGKFPEHGRGAPLIDAYDFRQPTPAPFTQVEVEDVVVDRAQGEAREWRRNWFMIRVRLLDDYDDEYHAALPMTTWTDDLLPAWQRIQAIVP